MLSDIWDHGLINVLLYLIVDNVVRIINIQAKLQLVDGRKLIFIFILLLLLFLIEIENYKIHQLMKIMFIPQVKQLQQQVQVVDKIDEHNVIK
jgi:hypothetical protein